MSRDVVIIGGGITGLAAAHRLQSTLGPGAVTLLECTDTLGGKIRSQRQGEFLLEAGPDSILVSRPAGLQLCRELGIASRLVGTEPHAAPSQVKRGDRLFPLPAGFSGLVPSRRSQLLASRLLSLPGRIRAVLEPLVPPAGGEADESVGAFFRRRFGREAYSRLFEPLLAGIHAGDGDQLSLDATFPQVRELERTAGSVLKGMRGREQAAVPLGAAFMTFPGGLAELVNALAEQLNGTDLRTSSGAIAVEADRPGYRVILACGSSISTHALIIATPAHAAAPLLAALDAELASCLRSIPHVHTAVVSLAYQRADVHHPLPGYGYLSPRIEGGPVVACTFVSRKFAGRAPSHTHLFRCFIGRHGNDASALADQAELVRLARAELRRTLGIYAEPIMAQVVRWPGGMPQYTLGHRDRVDAIMQGATRWPRLALAGASFGGVGIPDCIASGWRAADALAPALVPT
ncbi:MAG TPA: protoporphyrinogen oxidase [Gemmatimonadales bacterium]|nr:protoporphyrinogen oxidase [Gemmatimonadales bacterium]